MDDNFKIQTSLAFFKAHGDPGNDGDGNILSSEGLAIYIIVDPETTTFKDQLLRPREKDDGRRIIGYAYQSSASDNRLHFWNASRVTGKPNREIGLGVFTDDNTAEIWDAHPAMIAKITRNEDGTYTTGQFVEPPQREEPVNAVQRVLTRNTMAALTRLANNEQPVGHPVTDLVAH